MQLREKSVHQLRTIAQSFGVSDIFEKDALHLIQEIELKQQKLVPPVVELPPKPEYDARLMTAIPADKSDVNDLITLMEPYIKMGIRFRVDHENWFMDCGLKNDSGSLRQPYRPILQCAERLLK